MSTPRASLAPPAGGSVRPVRLRRNDVPSELWPPSSWDDVVGEWLVDADQRPTGSRLASAIDLKVLPEARRLVGLSPGSPVLRPQLVPKTAWCSNLRNHLPRNVWQSLSRRLSEEAGQRCELCGRRGSRHPTECHEWWAYDDHAATQTLASLNALCPMCHEANHFGLANIKGCHQEAAAYLATVNGWSIRQAEAEFTAVGETWKRRSALRWTLALDRLRDYGVEPPVAEPAGDRAVKAVERTNVLRRQDGGA